MLKKAIFLLLLPFVLVSFDFYRWENKRVAFIEKGRGDKHIILLHGFAANTFTWHYQMDLLASQGFHVWAFDFIGFGMSDKPSDALYSLDLYRGQLINFMNQMGIKRAHIIGHSMGGAIALDLAIQTPERVETLTLIDPASYPFTWPRLLQVSKQYGRVLAPFLNRKAIHYILTQIFYDRKKITSDQIDAYWEPIKRGGKQSLVCVLEAFNNQILEDLAKSYPDIKVPVFVIWGKEDKWIPSSTAGLFAKDIPHSKQAVLDKAGHAPQEERPAVVNFLLLRFLKSY